MRVHFAHHTLTPVKQWKLKKATIIFIKNTNLLSFSSLGNAIINITINLLFKRYKTDDKKVNGSQIFEPPSYFKGTVMQVI